MFAMYDKENYMVWSCTKFVPLYGFQYLFKDNFSYFVFLQDRNITTPP